MPITQDKVDQTKGLIYDPATFPIEVPVEATEGIGRRSVSRKVENFQFLRGATLFIQRRTPKFLTEVVPVWYLRDKLFDTAEEVIATVGGYIDGIRDMLQGNIDTERTDRIAGDTALRTDLTAEATTRAAADTALRTDLVAETTARTAGDATLQGNIDAERLARIAADTGLSTDIATEATARQAADATLQANLDAEAAARTVADTALQTSINNEATARAAADTAIRTDLSTEIADRTAADSALRTDLTTETTARTAADTALGTRIDGEATLRAQGDTALQTNIDAEAATRAADDTALRTDLTTETAARVAGDTVLGTRVDAEATARAAADTTLQGNIAAETAARTTAINAVDTRLTGDIAAEAAARTAGDIRLSDEISAIRLAYLPPIQQVLTTPLALTLDAAGAIIGGVPIPVDGTGRLNDVPVAVGQRLLLTAQADPRENRVIILDDPVAGTYHFAPDNVVTGSQYLYTSGGDYQGYSWVLQGTVDPVEGTSPLTWNTLIAPDTTRGDGTYTQLVGNQVQFITQSVPLLLRQIGYLPIEVYYLGDGGDGGTIQTDAATGDTFVIVDYTPRVLRDFPILAGTLPGTTIYPIMNTQYVGEDYLSDLVITPINGDQVRVDFVGVQNPNTVILTLGGFVPPLV